jgi:hypothetical protein
MLSSATYAKRGNYPKSSHFVILVIDDIRDYKMRLTIATCSALTENPMDE